MKQRNENIVNINVGQALPDNASQEACNLIQRQVSPDLQTTKQHGGFTLIELLVVVLIIGILAAVAVPQYKMAVDKSRLSKLLAMIDSVAKAEELYYLANNQYTKNWDELSVSLPGTITDNTMSADTWTVSLLPDLARGVRATDSQVPGVKIWHFLNQNNEWAGQNVCYANKDNKRANKLCKLFSHRKTNDNANPYDLIYTFQ